MFIFKYLEMLSDIDLELLLVYIKIRQEKYVLHRLLFYILNVYTL